MAQVRNHGGATNGASAHNLAHQTPVSPRQSKDAHQDARQAAWSGYRARYA